MQLSSPAFTNNTSIPADYTCQGKGISPPLIISDIPEATQSLALIVSDPDAPHGEFIHWIVWNISAATATIPEGELPAGAIQGENDFRNVGYGAPCPPSGTHRYVFEIYALNNQLALESGGMVGALREKLQDHILDKAQLIGTVSAKT